MKRFLRFFFTLIFLFFGRPEFSVQVVRDCLAPGLGGARPYPGLSSTESKAVQLLRLQKKQSSLKFRTEIEHEKSRFTSSRVVSNDRKRVAFQETLELNFDGSVYHPNLFDFNVHLELAPEQHKERTSFGSDDGYKEDLLASYRIRATILKEKPYNLSLFMDQTTGERKSDIYQSQEMDSSSYGGTFRFSQIAFPITLSYYNTERDVDTSFRPNQHFKDERLNLKVTSNSKYFGESYFDYLQHKFEYSEKDIYKNKGTQHTLTLSNRRIFGPDQKKALDSFVYYNSLNGNRDIDQFTVNEDFSIRHTDSFRSSYWYNFDAVSVKDNDVKEHQMGIKLRHQLYRSLTSDFDVKGLISEATDLDQKGIELSLNEEYQKKIGPTLLRLGAGCTYEKRKRMIHNETFFVTRDPYVLTNQGLVFLNEAAIDPATVVVYSRKGQILIQGRDYQLITSNGKIEIRRLPTSIVSSGEEVFTDYVVRNPILDYTLLQKNLRVSFGSLTPLWRLYYNRVDRDFSNVRGSSAFIPNRFDSTVYGAELRLGGLTSSAEYEDYEATLSPFRAIRLAENLRWNLSSNSYFNIEASYRDLKFTDTDEKREEYSLNGMLTLYLLKDLSCGLESGYRYEKGADLKLEDFIAKVTLNAKIRDLYFELGYEYNDRLFNNDDFLEHFGYIQCKRYF